MRQAYDYWQDQPGSPRNTRREKTHDCKRRVSTPTASADKPREKEHERKTTRRHDQQMDRLARGPTERDPTRHGLTDSAHTQNRTHREGADPRMLPASQSRKMQPTRARGSCRRTRCQWLERRAPTWVTRTPCQGAGLHSRSLPNAQCTAAHRTDASESHPAHERPVADDSALVRIACTGRRRRHRRCSRRSPRTSTLAQGVKRRHCEPDALQVCSRTETAHWVTVQSSRVAAALQAACSGAEGALPREALTPIGASLAVGRTDRCSTGAACQQPSTPRTHPSLGLLQTKQVISMEQRKRRCVGEVVKDLP